MKNLKYFITFIGIISIFIAGCTKIGDEEQYIDVQKRIGDVQYEDFKQITNNKQVKKVREILDEIDWVKAKVEMVRPPDYRFMFQYKDPEIEAKSAFYELWVSPNKDKVEIVLNAESKYMQLENNKSAELFEILTGEKLSDLQ